VLALSASPGAFGETIDLPTPDEVEDAIPEGQSLKGREIYERFLDNRLHSAVQRQTVISSDPGGNDQATRFWVRWKDYREDGEAKDGVLAKTMVKFQEPFDMRHLGFLLILREDRDHDQFVYLPSSRRVRRVKLNQAAVMGTDYNFGDIAFQDIEGADYIRHLDEEIEGRPVYVVEATFKPFVQTPYHRAVVYLEKEHYIPLWARYWDDADIEIKEMRSKASSIREFDGVWIATESTMHNLKQGTSSTLLVEDLDPDPQLAEQLFSVFRLELRRE
jgi:hypothetical protein